MPKNASVSFKERHEWLDKHQRGLPVYKIAKEANRDVRTVNKYLKIAEKEDDLRVSRQTLITEALRTHNNDMLKVVDAIVQALEVPKSNVEIRQADDGDWLDIPLSVSTGKRTPAGLYIKLHDEDSTVWRLLAEHLGADSPLTRLPEWKKCMVEYLKQLTAFKVFIADTVMSNTGLQMVKEPPTKPQEPVLFTYFVELVFPIFINRITGERDETDPEHNLKQDKDSFISLHGTGTHLAWDNNKNSSVIKDLLKTLLDVGQSQQYKDLMSHYQETVQVTKRVRDEFEEIQLIRYVAGQCRVCERLGK